MLVLTRKLNQDIIIDPYGLHLRLRIVGIGEEKVKLGFINGTEDVEIWRSEIWEEMKAEAWNEIKATERQERKPDDA